MKQKIEITNPRLARIAKDALDLGGKLELVSRSTGSGETVHAWIKHTTKGLKLKAKTGGDVVDFGVADLETILKDWVDRACSTWSEAAKTMVVLPLKDAPKTSRGHNVFYIRATVA